MAQLQRPPIAKNGAQLLQNLLGLVDDHHTSNPLRDMVLISIDLENLQSFTYKGCKNQNNQVGVAILDTKDIGPNSTIETYNFCTGSRDYCRSIRKLFIFGKALAVERKDLLENIYFLIPPSRDVILVGHYPKYDLEALHCLGFEFPESLVCIIDTYEMVQERQIEFRARQGSFQTTPIYTLGAILEAFQVPFKQLHCAGNDAHFTLRLLLLLITESCGEADTLNSERSTVFEEIAYAPLPFWLSPDERVAKRKTGKIRRGVKLRLMSLDFERHEIIRAERDARKAAAEEHMLHWQNDYESFFL